MTATKNRSFHKRVLSHHTTALGATRASSITLLHNVSIHAELLTVKQYIAFRGELARRGFEVSP